MPTKTVYNSEEKTAFLKSQFVTSSCGENRKLPYCFTEQGIYILVAVLKGDIGS